MKVAICYDRINKFGGAERVLICLKEIYPDAVFFTLTYNAKNAKWAEGWKIKTSFLQKIPILKNKHQLFPPVAGFAWEQFNFNKYDLVISVTSEAAKGIITSPSTLHICICLTPTRYLWSGFYEYIDQPGFKIFNKVVSILLITFSIYLRVWDYLAAQRPDIIIGISDEVCKRIEKYYRREPVLIYPPVAKLINRNLIKFENSNSKDKFFLVVSRLVPYKRIDIVVDAFNQLGWNLKIIGVGSEEKRLKEMARSSIQFIGFVTDGELEYYYKNCVAVIFSTNEDFGIVPVEAQSYGKPVIAYSKGGASETVTDHVTGRFFNEQLAESLINLFYDIIGLNLTEDITDKQDAAIKYFENFSTKACYHNAKKFSDDQFKLNLNHIISAEMKGISE